MTAMTMLVKSIKTIASCATAFFAVLMLPVVMDGGFHNIGINISLQSSVSAQDKAPVKTTRALPGISEKVLKGLGRVTEFVSPDEEKNPGKEPNFKAAYKELKQMEKRCAECNKYEKSQIYNMFAYVSYSLEKFEDAVNFYKKLVAQSPEIPIGLELQSMMYIAQLSFQLEKYNQSIEYLEKWMNLANETGNQVGAEIWQLKASICYQADQRECAFESINKSIQLVESKGKVAEESWYNLQRALYIDREDYKTATTILEKMILHYPKKPYWAQLGSMYGLLERSKDQLQAMEAAYIAGAFTGEKDLINLAYLHLSEGTPYRSYKIIKKGFKDKLIERSEKNLEVLSTALQASKEADLSVPILKELGGRSKSGNFYGQLAAVYLDLNKPYESIKSGKAALKKGKFTRGFDGEVHINMGIAYFDTRQYSKSIESFTKASKNKKYERFARSWRKYAETELARYNGLKKALADIGVDIEEVLN